MSAVFEQVILAVLSRRENRRATKFIATNHVIKATRQSRTISRHGETLLVTFGRPNFRERRFIRQCVNAGEPFPIKKVQIQPWPKKRK